MLRIAIDTDAFAMVGINSGTDMGEADYVRSEEALIDLTDRANRANAALTLIVVIDPEAEHPNAMRRKRMAGISKRMRKSRTALVTNSSIARGVGRVMEWLNPPGATRMSGIFGSFPEAVQWAEKDAGRPMPCLVELYRQARQACEHEWKAAPVLPSARSA
jgi:hypothetical protein